MAIGFYLSSRGDKLGRKTIYIRIRYKFNDYSHSTKVKVHPEDWNSKTLRIKSNTWGVHDFNDHLEEVKKKAFGLHDLMKAEIITFNELVIKMQGNVKGKSFDTLWDVYEKEKSPITVKSYKNAVNSFGNALGKLRPDLEDVEYNSILKAITVWKSEGKSPSTINSYVKVIGVLRTDAFKRKIVNTPFIKDRGFTQKLGRLKIETSTSDKMLMAIGRANTVKELEALALWLLSFISRGLYFSDFKELKPTSSGSFIHYRHKTGYEMNIDSLDGLILDLFQIVSHVNFDKPVNHQKSLKSLLGVPFKTARKTFDTLGVKLGIDIQIRFALLAHSDTSIKRHYTDLHDYDIIQKINESHKLILSKYGVVKVIIPLFHKLNIPLSQGSLNYLGNMDYNESKFSEEDRLD
tara:strand:- start:422 stop:1639 length:1218 start_codon:yes stop_codon:yes gene_type:complete